MKQPDFFDREERLARLSGLGDQLEAFSRSVVFEVFRPDPEKALAYSDWSQGGRPRFDALLMLKILVIQTLNNLSDQRPSVVHALSGIEAFGPRARCQNNLVVSRASDTGGCH